MAKDIKTSKRKGEQAAPGTDVLFDHQPPYNEAAERCVVGAIMLQPDLCDSIAVLLRADDFYTDPLKRIYRHLLEMHNSGTGIDMVLLLDHLKAADELVEIGGESYLASLMESVETIAHAEHYAKIVKDYAIRREIIRAGSYILQKAYEADADATKLLSQAEQAILEVGDSRSGNQYHVMFDIIQKVCDLVDNQSNGEREGVLTGFTDLDRMLGGLHPGELIILAARPSMGKTALATNIAEHVAVDQKKPVLFVSLEMAKEELAIRMICARGRIRGDRFKSNFLPAKDKDSFFRVASQLSNASIFIDDTSSRTVTEIGAVARRIKRNNDLGLIIVDYIGLIEPENPSDPRQEQVAKNARRLKGLARELNVPVLCLAQVNRAAEEGDGRPRLSNLRESGAIEQDADVVMFVYREEVGMKADDVEKRDLKGKAEIIIAKQRNGPVGEVKLAWMGDFTLFATLASGRDGEAPDYADDFAYDSVMGPDVSIDPASVASYSGGGYVDDGTNADFL
ncbi:MAG: replicative DNA helicase [Planctomycetia bacterium]|nr:replicative DNA helicase [Planctomycetia bacterium]